MSTRDYEVVDFRVRPMTKEFAQHWVASAGIRVRPLLGANEETPLETLFAEMDSAGVTKAVVAGRYVYSAATPEHIAGLVKSHPDRFIAGFAGIDALKRMDAVRETERVVKELGLAGIVLEPFITELPANDKIFYPLYAKCAELNTRVIIVTGAAPFGIKKMVAGHPTAIDDVAGDFPDLRLMMSHAGWPWMLDAIAVAKRHKNVYLEASLYHFWPGAEVMVKAADIIPDQIVYASGYPIEPISTMTGFRRLGYSEEAFKKIVNDNPLAFLRET